MTAQRGDLDALTDCSYTLVGIGVVEAAGGPYIVQMFAAT